MRAPSTVLMTADTLGGVFTYAVGLSRALSKHGIRVVLATMGGPLSASQRREASSVDGLTVIESAYRLEWMDDPWEDVEEASDWLLDIEDRLRPSIVHINGLVHARQPFRAPTVAVVHSCVLSWWRAVRGEEAPSRYDRYRREVTRGLGAAGAVIAPTRAMLEAASLRYGPFDRSFVISNAAERSAPPKAAKEAMILTVGRLWDDAKNVAALGRVAPRVPWPIVAIGSDAHPDHGARPVPSLKTLGVLDGEGVAEWMDRASIYALPARYEPFGLSVLEAALAGSALVLGDIASLREVWGDAATFVDPDDDAAIERALHRLIEDPSLRRAMAFAARRRALDYAPHRMARAYLDVYDALGARAERPESIEGSRESRCA